MTAPRIGPALRRALGRRELLSPPLYAAAEIRVETLYVRMRDGVQLATDLYLPPDLPAPVVAVRTPYFRDADPLASAFLSLSRRGYAIAAQDLRGTGRSEPEDHDFYVYEPEDGWDFVEWVSQQPWCDGFIGSFGASYIGQVQWAMATHPKMTTIVPEVSGLGVAPVTTHLHMMINSLARTIGRGEEKETPAAGLAYLNIEPLLLEETLSTGFYNEPLVSPLLEQLSADLPDLAGVPQLEAQARLWAHYCSLSGAGRAEFVRRLSGVAHVNIYDVEHLAEVFGGGRSIDSHSLPAVDPAQQCHDLHAIPLMRTGWYDWFLNDHLATWELLRANAPEPVRSKARLLVTPAAHNLPGYKEGMADHPELQHNHGSNVELYLSWFRAVREGRVEDWPRVIYYLMGANEWRTADDWPVAEAQQTAFYLSQDGGLNTDAPDDGPAADEYVYDPMDPTPTVGGSIVSHVYPAGSVDVSEVQQRSDVLTYTTPRLERDLDVVGPLRLVLYASSSAVDTDFAGRLSDVFPDGRAIQLQNGVLRARHRDLSRGPDLLEPGAVYRFEIDIGGTANRFKAGHRIRLDLSSADFPKLDRNANLGGALGEPGPACQTVYRDAARPSHLVLHVLADAQRRPDDA